MGMSGSASFQTGWKSISGYFLFADHPARNLLDHLSLSLTQQAELHQKWQIRTWKAARNSGS
jgi:hypothetical protein